MNMNAWRKLAAMGFVATAFAAGCVVSSDDDDGSDAGKSGTGGSAGSGGSAGTAGKGGTSGSAGSDASAGADGGPPVTCNPGRYDGGADSECQACLETRCCSEYLRCANDDRATPCWGTTAVQGEILCISDRIITHIETHDGGLPDEQQKTAIVMSCAKRGSISAATNELYTCINTGERSDGGPGQGCAVECFGG